MRAHVPPAPGCDAVASGKPYMQVSLCAAQVTPNYKLGLEGSETFDMQKAHLPDHRARQQA